jgi:phosphatidate cytidylyltransferase
MSEPGRFGTAADRFADLRPRLLSGLVMLAVGLAAIWYGGRVFEVLVLLIAGAMTWELARLGNDARPGLNIVIAAATALSVAGAADVFFDPDSYNPMFDPRMAVLLLGPALFLITPRRDRLLAAFWTLMVVLACIGLIQTRLAGFVWMVWILGVIVVSDAAGYFFGRLIGGPKFWPVLSPKKTWSGTIAGWIAAMAWTALLLLPWLDTPSATALILIAPVFAFAGQLADLYESWMKRRAGVKDVSNLIPGHGGLMDRFDAITGAAALGLAFEWLRLGLGV